ncbi:efflux RND transporter periplasmic adaptor subunit [Oceanihabitans sediminis]|uniref:efflux RND transporter periplasmic adaptor subunit n=1 Tax=Oceanihabitans sediminis TaxID=1812012 RepID=UPI00299E0DED|nr:efflux RND transporter periplasmic adaptor subunit [Oceanihabitans sediminis]MDX1774771.1 efflux RND transporter periplasmic adaptor subunit [Oceanihabitans sediminis]
MKIKHIVYAVFIFGILALVAYRIISNNEENNVGQKAGTRTVKTVTGLVVSPEKFTDKLSLSGTLEANEQVEIRSEINGVVEAINFEEGAEVSKGQVLLRVNDTEIRAQLSQVTTAQQLASENERRARLLLEKQAISQEEYDIASADFKSAKAQSQLISAQLKKASIRAPFSGTIGLRNISKGAYITPTTPIATLVNLDQLKITFSIPEKYANRMQVNNELSFSVSGSKAVYKAKIYAVEPMIDLTTRTLKVRAIADNPERALYPGMFANVKLPLETVDDAIMVPTEALIPIQNGKVIFILKDGKAYRIEVETGSRTDKDVRVTSGLKVGDTILTSGVMALKDGAPVNVEFEKSHKSTGTK